MKRKDILTPIGLILGVGFIILGISNGDVGLNGFYDLMSIFITIGGSFAALLITYPLDEIMLLIKMTRKLFETPDISKVSMIETFKELSIKARKYGMLSIENDIDKLENGFLKTGMELVVDDVDADLIVEILNNHISETEGRYNKGAKIYKTWGSYAPAFGMIGTLIGLIQMLAMLDNPDVIASGMAKALITTFYGAILANLVLNPMGYNLQNKAEREVENREMMLVGILSIKNGESTRVLEEKLMSFFNEGEKTKYLRSRSIDKRIEKNAS
ncbi:MULTISPECIES: motility protein A [Clostridium]|uniref:Chemotaxis protein MotA n=1 Tax=Clostridium cadaveris TaxID=1529 RepID=A0A1I2LVJ1_9CLOT|nr:MotA/TolQ/ExbB proton channel family protein [Clostridium cadaveris]MDU4950837.1 MotA/TolQ/ExbB proton channel family protein [Clostridium sp.]MDM8312339.1 MotA/TolQ/ExbB proton channel family protein [Clostridium cadaveris]MDY4948513.1 MotA/TolQ/ExbB proton channel family protein [Clostridium cadaveris]NME63751.1 motility protein A [Clostridium cadaveris]SFF83392.1 chemotaxis protein MotA [Clostridium cadaveris]